MLTLHACVVVRSDGTQLLLDVLTYIELLDELLDGCFGNRLIRTRQSLQRLVGMRVSLTTQDGLATTLQQLSRSR